MASVLGGRLRAAGVPVTAEQVGRFVRAVALVPPATRDELYWAGRVTLLRDRGDIVVYDQLFDRVFRGLADPAAGDRGDLTAPPFATRQPTGNPGHGDPGAPPLTPGQASGDAGGGDRGGEAEEGHEVGVVASSGERLAGTDFAELTDDELRELRALMARIRVALPLRPARRHRRRRRGDRIDRRATLRRSRRTGGDPVEQVTRRARPRPRRLVVLCDISGSMAPYARACLQVLHATARSATGPGPSPGRTAEVFTFATRLTRLTRALAVADPDAALAAAGTTAPDWRGGTRIGASLQEFLDRYGRRGVARGAVVVVVSDGWDRDDPALLAEQMARLRRLAHRVVWVNPRAAAPGYEPLVGGMAAALPHCDRVVSGHTLTALGDVLASLDA